ncbi:hypothetical protein HDU87_004709 [Geranomyces variabilis]|uniref:Uncharacterized protein n=1 Tax=Geranomyces variabilis TaxID=109894 RepID=A0AAD5TJF5_9FUNG|nr:hypothetical protein HDU87_004709 [Geranomyces variabilis]
MSLKDVQFVREQPEEKEETLTEADLQEIEDIFLAAHAKGNNTESGPQFRALALGRKPIPLEPAFSSNVDNAGTLKPQQSKLVQDIIDLLLNDWPDRFPENFQLETKGLYGYPTGRTMKR